jgi:tRNA (Thr-GGU) A37 N-methylase
VSGPVTFTPIGVVHTPFAAHAGMPVQTVAAQGVRGRIELDPAYLPALADLDGFTHRYGWFEQRAQNVHSVRADARFAEPEESA